MKKILKAWVEQEIQFDSEKEWLAFYRDLKAGRRVHEIMSAKKCSDGSVLVYLRKQYNNNKF